MKINKPKFWDEKIGLISILLLPLTVIFISLSFLKKKLTITRKFKLPIICVGNIYIGGTGKTPTSILLANELSKLGKNPAIIRKYYSDHADEYNLIKKGFKNLITKKNRIDALIEAEKTNFDVAILDDGLQDNSIEKKLSIICFNQNQLIGNGLVIPSGPLRENLSSLKEAHIVVINGKKIVEFEEKILKINNNLKIYYSEYKPTNIDEFKNKELLAIAGIGNPHNFFNLLSNNNLNVKKKFIFPDHYKFKKSEFTNIIEEAEKNNYKIIMTEKDYYKIKNFNFKEINYLKLKLEVKNLDDLLERILKLYV